MRVIRFNMDLSALPPEVLSQIFAKLPIENRKNVRLVSKLWNFCCNHPTIINNEKFSFWRGYSIKSVDSFLQNCERLRPTIEFQGYFLDKLPSENTWRLIGPKIKSLSITACTVSKDETVKNIILYCQNMHSFKFVYYIDYYDSDNVFCSPEVLDELIQSNIERPKVTSFELLVNFRKLPEDILQKLFKIFPCIQNFGIGHTRYTGRDKKYKNLDYRSYSQNPRILSNLINPTLIKELTVNLPSYRLCYLRDLAKFRQLKLRKLEAICIAYPMPENVKKSSVLDALIKFLRRQPQLQTLKLGWNVKKPTHEDHQRLLIESLSACPELIDFRIKSNIVLGVNPFLRIMQMVSKSKLKCFMLEFAAIYDPNDPVIYSLTTPSTNNILHTLKLESCKTILPEFYSLPVLKHFRNLRYLDITAASEEVFRTIFQHHTHLQTLRIYNCAPHLPSTSHDEGVNYSISRLSELEHLEIIGIHRDYFPFDRELKTFCFPRLKYLGLSIGQPIEKIMALEYQCPLVEVLMISSITKLLRQDQFLSLCKDMKRLKHIGISTWMTNEKDIKQIFTELPSLKYFSNTEYGKAYFYNRFTNSLDIIGFSGMYSPLD